MTSALGLDLAQVIRAFPSNPAAAGRQMRDAVRTDGRAFLRAVLAEADVASHRGVRYGIILLRDNSLLIPAIVNPAITSLESARKLTGLMLAQDSGFINSLLEVSQVRTPECILRVLDLIEEHAQFFANWRVIARLFEESDPAVQSRCAALLARYRFDERGAATRIAESGPRVRADIVEALWNKPCPEVVRLAVTSLSDTDNRVAGNASLALYQNGQTQALMSLAQMLGHENPKFQTTAAWAMGRTRDSRFAHLLQQTTLSTNSALRKAAARALGELETVGDIPTNALDPALVSIVETSSCAEVWLRVTDQTGVFAANLRPLDFVCLSAEPLLDYSVTEVSDDACAAIRIAFPADNSAVRQALLSGVAQKPASQKWAVAAYANSRRTGAEFFSAGDAVARAISGTDSSPFDAQQAIRSVLNPQAEGSSNHLVIFADAAVKTQVNTESLLNECRTRGISVHFIADAAAKSWPVFLAALTHRYVIRAPHRISGSIVIRSTPSPGNTRFSRREFLTHESAL